MESLAAVIQEKISECHYLYPDYNRKTSDLPAIAKIFWKHLADMAPSEARLVFDNHIRTSEKFPTPAALVGAMTPVTCYKMDYGPLGFGATYHPDHPYIRLQMKLGQDVSGYSIEVRACDATPLRLEARSAAPIGSVGEDEAPQIEPRRNGGFRRLEWDGSGA